jgi:bifunctional non-homologous end joining protein LigD
MAVFVVQEHHGKRLHWDFRLEIGGVLKSWAVPKGPSLDPAQRRLAIRVPDHGLEHGDYEGIIPEGLYGAGPVLIWDKGTFEMTGGESAADGLRGGTLTCELHGKILKGVFTLIRMGSRGRAESWLLIKKADTRAEKGWLTPVLLTPARRKKMKERRPPCGFVDG